MNKFNEQQNYNENLIYNDFNFQNIMMNPNQMINNNQWLNQNQIINYNKILNQNQIMNNNQIINNKQMMNQNQKMNRNQIINNNQIINRGKMFNQNQIMNNNQLINNNLLMNNNQLMNQNQIMIQNQMGNKMMNNNQVSNHNKIINNNNFKNQIIHGFNPTNNMININKKKPDSVPHNEKIILEKHIEGRPSSMSLNQMRIYIKQMENSVCKIQKSAAVSGTGFLVTITNESKLNPMNVLITCYHVLDENDLSEGKVLKLIFNNNKTIKTLKMTKSRKTYTNQKYDISIIELKKTDFFNEEDMLSIDTNLFKKEGLDNRQIYTLHYPNGIEVKYSSDIISNVYETEEKFEHYCSTESGSSGAPLIDFETGNVLGIHNGCIDNRNFGTILKLPIYEFYKENIEKKNEIYLELEVKADDVNKEVYFLDNMKYTDDTVNEKKNETSLPELNMNNTKLYINNIRYNYSKYFKPEKEGLYKIKLEFGIKMQDCSEMFHGCYNIIKIDLSNFNSENVINMKCMFSGCLNLKNIDLSALVTNNVENMSYMFYNCGNLKNLDISALNTENVKDMSGMFCGCGVKSLNLMNLNTKNVNNMTHMFYRCLNLSNLDLRSFDTRNVSNMSGLFAGCTNLTNVDVSSFNTKNVYYMSHLFYDCEKITNVNLSNFNTKNVDNMSSMFQNCTNLRTVDLSSFDTTNVINMTGMFSYCKYLVNLDLSSFRTDNLIYMSGMFTGCEYLYNLNISSFNCSNAIKLKSNGFFSIFYFMTKIFNQCLSLTNVKISAIDSRNPEFMDDLRHCGSKTLKILIKINN